MEYLFENLDCKNKNFLIGFPCTIDKVYLEKYNFCWLAVIKKVNKQKYEFNFRGYLLTWKQWVLLFPISINISTTKLNCIHCFHDEVHTCNGITNYLHCCSSYGETWRIGPSFATQLERYIFCKQRRSVPIMIIWYRSYK